MHNALVNKMTKGQFQFKIYVSVDLRQELFDIMKSGLLEN